jgi:hypothetical protein
MIIEEAKRLYDILVKHLQTLLWIMLLALVRLTLRYSLHSQTYLVNLIWTEWIIQKALVRIKAILRIDLMRAISSEMPIIQRYVISILN